MGSRVRPLHVSCSATLHRRRARVSSGGRRIELHHIGIWHDRNTPYRVTSYHLDPALNSQVGREESGAAHMLLHHIRRAQFAFCLMAKYQLLFCTRLPSLSSSVTDPALVCLSPISYQAARELVMGQIRMEEGPTKQKK